MNKILKSKIKKGVSAQKGTLKRDVFNPVHFSHNLRMKRYPPFFTVQQLGRMLKETPRNPGSKNQLIGRGVIGSTIMEPPINIPTLAQLGLDKKTNKGAVKTTPK